MGFRGRLLLLVLSLGAASAKASDSAEIARLAKGLAGLSAGVTIHKVAGRGTDEMLRDLALRTGERDEKMFRLENYPRTLPGVDESADLFGRTGTLAAADLLLEFSEALHAAAEKGDPTKLERRVRDVFAALRGAGAVFGYAAHGSSVCGVTYPSPLVIDEDARVIYEIATVGGPC